jgi:hypothetical protein
MNIRLTRDLDGWKSMQQVTKRYEICPEILSFILTSGLINFVNFGARECAIKVWVRNQLDVHLTKL